MLAILVVLSFSLSVVDGHAVTDFPCAVAPRRNHIEHTRKTAGATADNISIAEVMAYQGKYTDAAKLFVKAQAPER